MAAVAALLLSAPSFAGYDVSGHIARMLVDGNGTLWFRLDNTNADAYCQKQWYDFNFFVPVGNANYAYYYGIVLAAVTKNQPVYLGNISFFNGTQPCDITRTGFGIVLQQP